MAGAGYSGTPLVKKLGIQPHTRVLLLNAPDNFEALLDTDIHHQIINDKTVPDLVNLFAKNKAEFVTAMMKVLALYKKNRAMVTWVSWYKKSAGLATDLNENVIRDFALQHDLVDIKVCAVSEIWSGLKLVMRIAKR